MKTKLFAILVLLLTFFPGCYITTTVNGSNDVDKQNMYAHLDNSTVALVKKNTYDQWRPYCSGVYVSQWQILSARHCITEEDANGEGEDVVSIGRVINYQTFDQFDPTGYAGKSYSSYIEAVSDNSDLVLLHSVDDVNHDIANIYAGQIFAGQTISIIGHPKGLLWSHNFGIVSQQRVTHYPRKNSKVIQVYPNVFFGNSGGPAFDDTTGKLLGIASYIQSDDSYVYASFFVHRDSVVEFLKEYNVMFSF